jgi:hypothetical protein
MIGVTQDVRDLIRVWLKDQSFNVLVDNNNSVVFDLICGAMEGSIL